MAMPKGLQRLQRLRRCAFERSRKLDLRTREGMLIRHRRECFLEIITYRGPQANHYVRRWLELLGGLGSAW